MPAAHPSPVKVERYVLGNRLRCERKALNHRCDPHASSFVQCGPLTACMFSPAACEIVSRGLPISSERGRSGHLETALIEPQAIVRGTTARVRNCLTPGAAPVRPVTHGANDPHPAEVVANRLTHVVEVHTAAPAGVRQRLRPPRSAEACLEIIQNLVWLARAECLWLHHGKCFRRPGFGMAMCGTAQG